MNKFDPRKWLNIEKDTKPTAPKTVSVTTPSSTLDDIETITQRIEASQLDITSGYAAWRDLGFALAEELGEGYGVKIQTGGLYRDDVDFILFDWFMLTGWIYALKKKSELDNANNYIFSQHNVANVEELEKLL